MFFRLKKNCGGHNQNGRDYKPGDVVKTSMDLCKKFPNKFEKIYDKDDKRDTGKKVPKIQIPKEVNAPTEDTGSGDSKQLDSEPVSNKQPENKLPKKGINSKKYGINVTEEFPIATENDFCVYEKTEANGKWYNIIEMDEDRKKVLLKKARKKDVVNFIEEILNEEIYDDEDEEDDD